jgi:NTE family protein
MSEAERRAVIAARLSGDQWPDVRLLITAVAADTGEFVVFDQNSGVSLVDAVGASCAVPGVWPPVTINARRYIDGGMRSPANVDLAKGCDRIVVIAPIASGFRRQSSAGAQLGALTPPARSLLITPDQLARRAIGRNVLDPARRGPSAEAGRRQALELATAVRDVWAD